MPFCLSVCLSVCCVQAEALSDEVFAQRHLALEQKEKLRWSSWDKRKHRRRPTRCGHPHKLINVAIMRVSHQ